MRKIVFPSLFLFYFYFFFNLGRIKKREGRTGCRSEQMEGRDAPAQQDWRESSLEVFGRKRTAPWGREHKQNNFKDLLPFFLHCRLLSDKTEGAAVKTFSCLQFHIQGWISFLLTAIQSWRLFVGATVLWDLSSCAACKLLTDCFE